MIEGLSKTAFWDVDFTAIDFEQHQVFVTERVFNFGLLADQKAIVNHYGKEQVITNVLQASYFDKKVLNFLCVIYNLKPNDFKCYKRIQLNPEHWNY